jgi:hypothetical protein
MVVATVVVGADLPQPLAALAPLEAAPIPRALMARTQSPAANRAERLVPQEVAFFDAFMVMSFV